MVWRLDGSAGRWIMQPADNQFTRRGRRGDMLAMVLLDSRSTNYDSRNDLRVAHHLQHPVQNKDDQFRSGA